jgi:hypothetical protein
MNLDIDQWKSLLETKTVKKQSEVAQQTRRCVDSAGSKHASTITLVGIRW